VSAPSQLEQEAIAFSHDSSPETIPSVDEILSGLSELRGDISHLSDLKSEEDRAVEGLFQALMKLTQLLQWATVETSVLPVELGEVESAKVTPEGALIYCRVDGEIGTLDLSDYDNRDVLVDVVRDLAPKLREIMENPPDVEEPVVEEPEPEPELGPEPEPVEEMPVIEEPAVEELDVVEEAEEPITEPTIEEPVAKEEPAEQVIEEPSEPPTLEPPLIGEAVEQWRRSPQSRRRSLSLRKRSPRIEKSSCCGPCLGAGESTPSRRYWITGRGGRRRTGG
jgi:hypothetical protein